MSGAKGTLLLPQLNCALFASSFDMPLHENELKDAAHAPSVRDMQPIQPLNRAEPMHICIPQDRARIWRYTVVRGHFTNEVRIPLRRATESRDGCNKVWVAEGERGTLTNMPSVAHT